MDIEANLSERRIGHQLPLFRRGLISANRVHKTPEGEFVDTEGLRGFDDSLWTVVSRGFAGLVEVFGVPKP